MRLSKPEMQYTASKIAQMSLFAQQSYVWDQLRSCFIVFKLHSLRFFQGNTEQAPEREDAWT